MTGKELITEMLDMNLSKEVLVKCYANKLLLKIVDAAQPGYGEPDHGKIVLTGVIDE
jgi:hypothetical protein